MWLVILLNCSNPAISYCHDHVDGIELMLLRPLLRFCRATLE